MSQYFYSHLVPLDEAVALLDARQLTDEEKEDLINLIHSIFHHRILDHILKNTPKSEHARIIKMISADPSDFGIIVHVKTLSPDIDLQLQDLGKSIYYEVSLLLNR